MSTTALDLIKGALRRVNAYQPGEAIAPLDAQDCLDTLNDLFDSLSTDHNSIVGSVENILYWTAQQNQYTIGNPLCTDLGSPPFTGTLTGGSNQITGVTNVPANLVAGTALSGVGAGSTLTDTAGVIPEGTYCTAFGAGTVTMSQNASATPSSGTDTMTYTVPGDFAIPRPLRITSSYTRFNALDFTLDVCATQGEYNAILYKAQPGPWPTIAWYNPQMPYGILNVYQTPGNGAELHLFTDSILGNLTLDQVFYMPQGYNRWMKWILAKEICAEFGYPMTEAIKTNAADAASKIKALNAQPAVVSRYDRQLVRGNRPDAGYIFHGGYGRS
jgi:hypothetical protein